MITSSLLSTHEKFASYAQLLLRPFKTTCFWLSNVKLLGEEMWMHFTTAERSLVSPDSCNSTIVCFPAICRCGGGRPLHHALFDHFYFSQMHQICISFEKIYLWAIFFEIIGIQFAWLNPVTLIISFFVLDALLLLLQMQSRQFLSAVFANYSF